MTTGAGAAVQERKLGAAELQTFGQATGIVAGDEGDLGGLKIADPGAITAYGNRELSLGETRAFASVENRRPEGLTVDFGKGPFPGPPLGQKAPPKNGRNKDRDDSMRAARGPILRTRRRRQRRGCGRASRQGLLRRRGWGKRR